MMICDFTIRTRERVTVRSSGIVAIYCRCAVNVCLSVCINAFACRVACVSFTHRDTRQQKQHTGFIGRFMGDSQIFTVNQNRDGK